MFTNTRRMRTRRQFQVEGLEARKLLTTSAVEGPPAFPSLPKPQSGELQFLSGTDILINGDFVVVPVKKDSGKFLIVPVDPGTIGAIALSMAETSDGSTKIDGKFFTTFLQDLEGLEQENLVKLPTKDLGGRGLKSLEGLLNGQSSPSKTIDGDTYRSTVLGTVVTLKKPHEATFEVEDEAADLDIFYSFTTAGKLSGPVQSTPIQPIGPWSRV
jgi:hypothetical protein